MTAQPRTLETVIIEFDSDVFLWDARTQSWFFTTVPAELGEMIREMPRPTRGFGSVRVEATVGATTWRTSIFPDSSSGSYVLPLKKAVRDAANLVDGSRASVRLEILDV